MLAAAAVGYAAGVWAGGQHEVGARGPWRVTVYAQGEPLRTWVAVRQPALHAGLLWFQSSAGDEVAIAGTATVERIGADELVNQPMEDSRDGRRRRAAAAGEDTGGPGPP